MSATSLVLHVWPGRWDLPSIDAICLEATLHLQLTFPGRYSLVETADPDLSPTGQLPFLTHAQLVVSGLHSIVSYLSSLDPSLVSPVNPENDVEIEIDADTADASNTDLDAGLNALHLSQRVAWRAYIEAQLGDLVTHSFFVLEPNYHNFTHSMLASMLSVPQRYYVPRRIKESHRPRLAAVGLWQIANAPEEPEKHEDPRKRRREEDRERTVKRAFGQAKLVEKARLVFDILTGLLVEKSFIFDNRPTSVDLALASRILLLLKAPLPNPVLRDLLNTSYPSLTSHADRVHGLAFPTSPTSSNPRPPILPPSQMNPLSVLKSSLIHLTRNAVTGADESEEAKRFRRYRWGWIGLAIVGAVGYLATQGLTIIIPVVIERDGQEDGDQFEEVVADQEEDEELLDDLGMDDEPAL